MKKLLLIILTTAALSVCWANPTTMFVWMKDGSKSVFQLSEKPRLSFNDKEMTIKTPGTSIVLPYEQLANITYQDFALDVNDSQGDKTFAYDGDNLSFTAFDKALKVTIIRTDGVLVRNLRVQPNENVKISASELPQGSYVVVINGITYKIMKP